MSAPLEALERFTSLQLLALAHEKPSRALDTTPISYVGFTVDVALLSDVSDLVGAFASPVTPENAILEAHRTSHAAALYSGDWNTASVLRLAS